MIKKEQVSYETETKPEKAGVMFNADVVEESSQNILLLTENLTSYMAATILPNQTKTALLTGLRDLVLQLRLGPYAKVRVDAKVH